MRHRKRKQQITCLVFGKVSMPLMIGARSTSLSGCREPFSAAGILNDTPKKRTKTNINIVHNTPKMVNTTALETIAATNKISPNFPTVHDVHHR